MSGEDRTDRQKGFFITMDEHKRALLCVLFAAALLYLFLAFLFGYNLWEHSPYDSYTLQALAWRSGRLSLDRNYEWLELAVYKGNYFVSFPPFPTVIMLILSLFFGPETPSMAVNMCFFLGSTALAYAIIKRYGRRPFEAAFLSLFLTAGCNLLEVSMSGGVWNIAQGASFFFTMACLYALETPYEECRRIHLFMGPLCIAIAVGCRPFQAVYVPYVLFRLYHQCRRRYAVDNAPLSFVAVLKRMVPYLAMPAFIAAAYGALNFARFGDVFEFGHNYLPEFSTEGGVQFSVSHWKENLKNIFRLPNFQDNRLVFPKAYGFAFYLCNPLYVMALIETVRRLIKGKMNRRGVILLVSIFVHFNLLLLHRTFGGVQFGTRYLIDLIPVLMVFTLSEKDRLSLADWLLMIWGIAFNFYGALVYFYFI